MKIYRIFLTCIIVFLFSGSYDGVYAQNGPQPQPLQTNILITLIAPISTIIVAVIGAGGLITVYLGPILKERFELREQYFVPYRQWCIEFYGDAKEFELRYLRDVRKDFSKVSHIQIILDFWSLHHVIVDAYQWIGKISKENDMVAKELEKIIEPVESFWHRLEDKYDDKIPEANDPREFHELLKKVPKYYRKEIAEEIYDHLSQGMNVYKEVKFDIILRYLEESIPTESHIRLWWKSRLNPQRTKLEGHRDPQSTETQSFFFVL